MTVRKLATLRKINEIKPNQGADMIEQAIVKGWPCVVKKGEFNPGDPGGYVEIDSNLPLEERYEFPGKSSSKKIPHQRRVLSLNPWNSSAGKLSPLNLLKHDG
jgi:hypothetical protein